MLAALRELTHAAQKSCVRKRYGLSIGIAMLTEIPLNEDLLHLHI